MLSYVPFIVLLFAGCYAYTLYAKKRFANLPPDEQARVFNSHWSCYFDLEDGETLAAVWQGLAFTGASNAASQLAGAALNKLAKAAVGVSTYTPYVYVGQTSRGRVLIACEHSEMGERGNFEQVGALAAGTRAFGPKQAALQDVGSAPSNPFNPLVGLQFVQFRSPSGETHCAWLSPQGLQANQASYGTVFEVLA